MGYGRPARERLILMDKDSINRSDRLRMACAMRSGSVEGLKMLH